MQFIIDGLLYTGAYLFVGAPKVGKSFFMAQLAYHVSTGQKLWDYDVHQGTVLYLALEDDYRRLQARMSRMFGVGGAANLRFAVYAKQLGAGLDEQLEKFVRDRPDTRLIIIDTLQKIREAGGDAYSYANDYEIIGRMKQFADKKGVCVLLVHHTRKQLAGDKFEMISGTNGLLGCADGAFLLQKEKRTDLKATLDIVGRDQPDQRLYLIRDPERLSWLLDHAETELWESPPDPLLDKIDAVITEDNPEWNGSATELVSLLQEDMYDNRTHRVPDRIVSVSQPFVRPIVRGKAGKPVEFGAKLDISVVDGWTRLECYSFDAYNEAGNLRAMVERFCTREGHYPSRILADKIYRNRENLSYCKERGIRLSGPALGRPRKDDIRDKAQDYLDECERVEVERRFSLAKRKCGMGLVTAKLQETAAHVIAMSVLVLNLRKIQRALLRLLTYLLAIFLPKEKWAIVQ